MLEAVKYLHEKGITHRDLKPENILLSCDDNDTLIKVTDFGLSKIVGEQSLMQTLCGTPSYLAPEVIKSAGLGGYDKAVDCWSMGVILYIMLGGYPPFSDEIKEYTLQDQICNGRYSFPKEYWNDVSKDAIDLITKLLTIDSQKRITTAEALNHPWMKDDKVINKAHSLMCKATDNFKIPPPKLGSKRSNSDEDSIQSSTKRPHLDNTPPPHICNNYTANFPDNTTIVRTSSVASTISTHSLSSE
jgi:serine/threonine-protein kinase Chk2